MYPEPFQYANEIGVILLESILKRTAKGYKNFKGNYCGL
jgi:hypothetical protein